MGKMSLAQSQRSIGGEARFFGRTNREVIGVVEVP